MNNCVFIGRVTKDLELRTTKSGTSICNISLALNESNKTTFLNITAYGKLAELSSRYVFKGKLIAVNCKIENNNWEDKSGKHYGYNIVANNIHFLSSSQEKKEPNNNFEISEEEIPF